jgi:cytochrome c553
MGTLSKTKSPLQLCVLASAGLAVLFSHVAVGQAGRSEELIERALALPPNARSGKDLFDEHCAACHGPRAHGDAGNVIPALAAQLPIYLIKQLVDMSEGGREVPEMHRVASRKALTAPQSIRDLATYVSRLPRNSAPEHGDGNDIATGRRYYQGLCAFCHGEQGEGNDAHATPAVRGQHYSYLLAQMRKLSAMHRYSVNVEIVEALEGLPFDRATAVADYMSRLPDASMAGSTVAAPASSH